MQFFQHKLVAIESVRYFDNREQIYDIVAPRNKDPILVVCPKCQSKALVIPDTKYKKRCVCTKCSFYKSETDKNMWIGWRNNISTDRCLYLELWLYTYCCGNLLYAFTQRHLDFLEAYVTADLRERRQDEYGWRNSLIASRLPQWIKSHKNREQLIKAIQRLREKL